MRFNKTNNIVYSLVRVYCNIRDRINYVLFRRKLNNIKMPLYRRAYGLYMDYGTIKY